MWTIVFYNYSSLFGETQVDDFIKQATKKTTDVLIQIFEEFIL